MSLEMKYFVLKPRSKEPGDPYAKAARCAMRSFAENIKHIDPELADSLWEWTVKENKREQDLKLARTINAHRGEDLYDEY